MMKLRQRRAGGEGGAEGEAGMAAFSAHIKTVEEHHKSTSKRFTPWSAAVEITDSREYHHL